MCKISKMPHNHSLQENNVLLEITWLFMQILSLCLYKTKLDKANWGLYKQKPQKTF